MKFVETKNIATKDQTRSKIKLKKIVFINTKATFLVYLVFTYKRITPSQLLTKSLI